MNNFGKFIDEKISQPMARLAEQRHLRAIRDGIIATLPLIIVSSMFLVIAFLPNQLPENWRLSQFISDHQFKILLPYRVTMYIMTLYAVFGIGYSLSRSYKLDPLSGGILAEMAYLLTVIPKLIPEFPEALASLLQTNPELADYVAQTDSGFMLPMQNLGSAGMFVGILSAIIAVEIYRWTQQSGFKISMPEQVPESVARSFESLTPTTIILLLFAAISMWLEVDLHGMVGKLVTPLVSAADTLISVIVLVVLQMTFWSFGIHGASIVGTVARPIWLQLIEANTTAFAAGTPIPHIAAEPFYQWFIYIGGSGTTIGLGLLLLFRSRSKYAKTLGKTAILPCIFNINEPLIFGAPIMLNPILIIPFILNPIISGIIAWIVTSIGLVNPVVAIAPWTLPGPIGAYLATGGDFRAAILNIFLIILSIVIYYPFFRRYDEQLLKEEQGEPSIEEG